MIRIILSTSRSSISFVRELLGTRWIYLNRSNFSEQLMNYLRIRIVGEFKCLFGIVLLRVRNKMLFLTHNASLQCLLRLSTSPEVR